MIDDNVFIYFFVFFFSNTLYILMCGIVTYTLISSDLWFYDARLIK